jgi:hypothetical protein
LQHRIALTNVAFTFVSSDCSSAAVPRFALGSPFHTRVGTVNMPVLIAPRSPACVSAFSAVPCIPFVLAFPTHTQ